MHSILWMCAMVQLVMMQLSSSTILETVFPDPQGGGGTAPSDNTGQPAAVLAAYCSLHAVQYQPFDSCGHHVCMDATFL
jgi:hypothetical protein